MKRFAIFWRKNCVMKLSFGAATNGRSQNLKQVPQNLMKVFNVNDITQSRFMTSYGKINITSEMIINYRVTSPSNSAVKLASQFEKEQQFPL